MLQNSQLDLSLNDSNLREVLERILSNESFFSEFSLSFKVLTDDGVSKLRFVSNLPTPLLQKLIYQFIADYAFYIDKDFNVSVRKETDLSL